MLFRSLAARLTRTEKIDPQQLVGEAWAVYWEGCRVLNADYQKLNAYFEEEAKARDEDDDFEEPPGEPLPQPDKFPVTFQQIELLLLPKLKGRQGERAAVFREYALSQIVGGSFTIRGGFRVLSYWDFQPELLAELRKKFRVKAAEWFASWRKGVYGVTAYPLDRCLRGHGYDCNLVAPSKIPRAPGDRVKTNRRDADQLARLHRAVELTALHVPAPEDEAVRDLLRAHW